MNTADFLSLVQREIDGGFDERMDSTEVQDDLVESAEGPGQIPIETVATGPGSNDNIIMNPSVEAAARSL